MTSTLKPYRKGAVREDGYIFQGRTKQKGSPIDIWLSPKSYTRDRINSVRWKAKKRASEEGIPFDVSTDYLVSIFPYDFICPVLKTDMSWGQESGIESSPSLDKIDPSLGYVIGNVVWVSRRANRLKSDASPKEMRLIYEFYSRMDMQPTRH